MRKKETLICLLFVIAALTQGLFYAFTIPLGQVPDEMTHYQMIEDEFGTTGYIDELKSNIYETAGLNRLPQNAGEKVDRTAYEAVTQVHFSKPLSFGSFHPRFTIVRHFPSGIGFYMGVALQLPVIWCTYLAEIFSVLFYVGIGYLILRTAPIKKDIFVFCLLIPQTLQMCTSVNYDAVLIPCCFLLFSYILKLYYSENTIKWKNILVILLLTGIITITKAPYGLIALTILIIPPQRFNLKISRKYEIVSLIRKYWFAALPLAILIITAGLYAVRDNVFIKTVLSDILAFPQFVSLMSRTIKTSGYYYITGFVGIFGWLDSAVSSSFIIVFLIMMTYLNSARIEPDNHGISAGKRIWLIVVFAAAIILSYIALQEYSYDYLRWDTSADLTTYISYAAKLGTILGYQGRYWIPCLPVLLIALSGNYLREKKKLYWFAQIAYYTYAFITVIEILNNRYWIR